MTASLEDAPTLAELGELSCPWRGQPCDLCRHRQCAECPDCAPEDAP